MTFTEFDRVREYAARGLSDAQIGVRLGVHARTVLRWRAAAGIPSAWTPHPTGHGLSGYKRGCRCETCRAANAASARAAYAALQARHQTAPRHRERWTEAEDQTVTRLPASAAAEALGRTYAAITARRSFLARRDAGGTA